MSFCTNCGKQTPDDAVVCPYCGNALGTGEVAPTPVPAPVSIQGKLTTRRSLGKFFWLSMITFGIYGVVQIAGVGNDINIAAQRYDGKRTKNFWLVYLLLSWLTLGIYPLVWWSTLCSRLGQELQRRGINYSFGAKYYWLYVFVGGVTVVLPLIFFHKFFKAMNQIAEHYNQYG